MGSDEIGSPQPPSSSVVGHVSNVSEPATVASAPTEVNSSPAVPETVSCRRERRRGTSKKHNKSGKAAGGKRVYPSAPISSLKKKKKKYQLSSSIGDDEGKMTTIRDKDMKKMEEVGGDDDDVQGCIPDAKLKAREAAIQKKLREFLERTANYDFCYNLGPIKLVPLS
ncbi:OLC1v1033852C1 [Oldenlandia corymbosa var. corymbosa]|uniref:OLC1v1033852C1 n=1 Tax=Oldenlandia corymbosa var. corymbosa TaxID=529605 RepID=A0AAV1CP67_OLDCO|nr:OLC1v1033852C1 [Oldenlandia corymbosa var. corymbosa]